MMMINITWLALAWAVALVSAAPKITLIDLPTPNSLPCDMALGKDNNIYTLSPGQKLLIRINTATGQVTEFPLPSSEQGHPSSKAKYLACAVRADPRGNIYAITGYNVQVAKFNPQTETMTALHIPTALSNQMAWSDLWPALDTIYLSNLNGSDIVAVNSGGSYRIYNTTFGGTRTNGAVGLFLANPQRLFYTQPSDGIVILLNPKTGAYVETAGLYNPGGPVNQPQPCSSMPCYIRAESGGLLYITGVYALDIIAPINATTGYNHGTGFGVDGIPLGETVDGAGNVWWTATPAPTNVTLGYYNPNTNKVTSVALPGPGTAEVTNSTLLFLLGMQYVQSSNRVYFAQPYYNRVGYVDVSTA